MGFIFFLSLGAAQISKTRQLKNYESIDDKDGNRLAMGSMAIIASFVYLADTLITVYMVKKERSSY